VNPWQITRVFLSTQTLAVEDMERAPGRTTAADILEAMAVAFIVADTRMCELFVAGSITREEAKMMMG
jgi:hypothetical protein